jgi:polar amino acid transport system ATP-binding protein
MKKRLDEAEQKALSLLAKVGLSEKRDSYPCQLSGGQQQRVSIARALALSPDVLCFDEPTSALDPEITGEVLKIIKELAAEDMTMIIVTHEMAFARDVSDKIIFMDGGVISAEGSPAEIFSQSENARLQAFLSSFYDTAKS